MVAAVGARALALLVIACACVVNGPPAEAQPRALDADAAGLVARRYFEARHWGARACALLALGDRFHPDGAGAVLDALVGRDRRLVALPVGEILHQLAIERVGDVERGAGGVGLPLRVHAHGSRWMARFGRAFIRRFHSLMYSRMNTSSVAGAMMVPSGKVRTRSGMPSPRFM